MVQWLLKLHCKHADLELKTITYNTETITSMMTDYEVVCSDCGKLIMNTNVFRDFIGLIGAKS